MDGGRRGGADRFLDACAARPGWAVVGTLGYVSLVAASHDAVQDLAYLLQSAFGKRVWAPVVAGLGAVALALACRAAARRLAASPVRAEAAAAWWTTCALLVAAFLTLLATNMEAIHFVQYAIPAWPLLAATRRLGAAVVLVTALGAFDEWWQYAVLHADWGVPWDMNDVVLNALGAALGCAAALVLAAWRRREPDGAGGADGAMAWPVGAALVAGGGTLALRAAGVVALYPEEGPAPFLFSRVARPESRWEVPEWGRGHYQLHPGASLAICVALAAGFAWIDRRVVRAAGRSDGRAAERAA